MARIPVTCTPKSAGGPLQACLSGGPNDPSKKSRHGVESGNPAPHPGIDERNSTLVIGLRASLSLDAVRQSERAVDAITPAVERTRSFLFQPFRLSTYLKLCLVRACVA
ncbi:MAG: DUF7544 domain-containing protein [Acidobacteriaceae bacterium]